MNYNQKLLHLSTQLYDTNLGQTFTKQFFVWFSLWCKKVTLAIQEKTLKQNMVKSKCLNNIWTQILMVVHSM